MPRPQHKAFTLLQLILAVFVIAVMLRIALPMGDQMRSHRSASPHAYSGLITDGLKKSKMKVLLHEAEQASAEQDLSSGPVSMMPFAQADSDDGPLLARVLRRLQPGTTDAQAGSLADTLPPNEDGRVIVIVPTPKPAHAGCGKDQVQDEDTPMCELDECE